MNSLKKTFVRILLLMSVVISHQVYALAIDTTWIDDHTLASTVYGLDLNSTEAVGCAADTGCYLGIGFILKSEPAAGVTVDQSFFVHGSTVGEVEKDLLQQIGGLPWNTTEKFIPRDGKMDPKDYCATMVSIVGGEWNGNYRTLGSSLCSDLPPKNVTCSIKPSTINISHGTLSSGEVDGHSASKEAQISCTEDSSVTFYFESADASIPLNSNDKIKDGIDGSGIVSSIKINGKDAKESTLTVDNVGSKGVALNITSILHSSGGINPGDYNGSEVFIYSPN